MNSSSREPETAKYPWRKSIVVALSLITAVTLIYDIGFAQPESWEDPLSWLESFLALGFVGLWIFDFLGARNPKSSVRLRRAELTLIGLGIIALLSFNFSPLNFKADLESELQVSSLDLAFWIVRGFLFACVFLQLLRGLEWVLTRGIRPELILAASFIGIIVTSAAFLLLPNSMTPGAPKLEVIDAVFIATSSACVTGLSTRELGTDFSLLGQMIVMVTVQIGGLGIVTFVALLSSISRKSLPVPQMVLFREMIKAPAMGDLRRRIAGIVGITLIVEAIGAVALYMFSNLNEGPLGTLKWAVFHSISAFCNAGFALQKGNLEPYAANMGVIYTVMTLIVLGGLGFLVIPELLIFFWQKIRAFWRRIGRTKFAPFEPPVRLTVQTKFSLIVTAFLLVIGAFGYWFFEAHFTLNKMPADEAFSNALFHSVVARTAGFDTVPLGQIQNATLILITFLMIIGGCPISTSGGIKTVTFAILLLGLRTLITQRSRIEAFGRTIPSFVVFTALNVFLLYMVTAFAGLMLVCWLEPEFPIRDILFECFSALSTVGLTTGITSQMGAPAKLVLCSLMFIGRIGPIALVLSVFQRSRSINYEFPDEDVVVG